MKVKATRNFTGLITMTKNEERNVTNQKILTDLLDCGYVVPVEDVQSGETVEKNEEKQPSAVPEETEEADRELKETESKTASRKSAKGKK